MIASIHVIGGRISEVHSHVLGFAGRGMHTVGIAGIGRRGSAGTTKGRAHRSFERRIIGIMIGWRLVMGGKGKHNNV